MTLSDKEVARIRDAVAKLSRVGNCPRRNQVYNIAREISLILMRAERREKGRLL
jgi:hypothetical protein